MGTSRLLRWSSGGKPNNCRSLRPSASATRFNILNAGCMNPVAFNAVLSLYDLKFLVKILPHSVSTMFSGQLLTNAYTVQLNIQTAYLVIQAQHLTTILAHDWVVYYKLRRLSWFVVSSSFIHCFFWRPLNLLKGGCLFSLPGHYDKPEHAWLRPLTHHWSWHLHFLPICEAVVVSSGQIINSGGAWVCSLTKCSWRIPRRWRMVSWLNLLMTICWETWLCHCIKKIKVLKQLHYVYNSIMCTCVHSLQWECIDYAHARSIATST